MNFFEAQEQAKRNTGRLVFLFVLGMLGLIAVTSLAFILLMEISSERHDYELTRLLARNGELIADIALWITLIVLLGSGYKLFQLRAGGELIAERLGGKRLDPADRSPEAHKVLNVVEEMAIASGIPAPPVYVLEDSGINAFAAGTSPRNAVIGITRGALHLLSRDELQGVIAHEFSHIFHGDMRLNMRLIGVLHGLLFLNLVGQLLVRFTGRRSSSEDKSRIALSVIGLVLIICGYVGAFFGGLIRAAVSRQREFLADAAAVQFTRNPAGIAGALKKIGGCAAGSILSTEHASEFSHLYFSSGIKVGLTGFLATHPPLEERIHRIDPAWDGKYINAETLTPSTVHAEKRSRSAQQTQAGSRTDSSPLPILTTASGKGGSAVNAAIGAMEAIDAIGSPGKAHLDAAQTILAQIPAQLIQASRSQQDAAALAYTIVAHTVQINATTMPDTAIQRRPAAQQTDSQADSALNAAVAALSPALYLNLLDLTLPALAGLPQIAQQTLLSDLKTLLGQHHSIHERQAGQGVSAPSSLSAWAYAGIIKAQLERQSQPSSKYQIADLSDAISCLLGMLAQGGHDQPAIAHGAFTKAAQYLNIPLRWPDPEILTTAQLESAIRQLAQLRPLQKPLLLKAMVTCVKFDGKITPTEAELIRAIADLLDCPMPPVQLTEPVAQA